MTILTREVNNTLTGWTLAHLVNDFPHPVNQICALLNIATLFFATEKKMGATHSPLFCLLVLLGFVMWLFGCFVTIFFFFSGMNNHQALLVFLSFPPYFVSLLFWCLFVCILYGNKDWIELNWIELNWIELNWIELNWIELNWIELNWIIQSREFRPSFGKIDYFRVEPPLEHPRKRHYLSVVLKYQYLSFLDIKIHLKNSCSNALLYISQWKH